MIIDKHILKEWLKALSVTLMLILGILILEEMYKNLKTFLEHEASWGTLLIYYAYFIPNCFCTVLPISFFISVLYTLNDMQAHNEIIALRASGLTIFRITRTFWIASFVLMLLMALFNAYILPLASDKMHQTIQTIEYNYQKKRNGHTDQIGLQYHLCLHNENEGRLWHIKTFSLYTHRGTYATLSLMRNNEEVERIEAESIKYNSHKGLWTFYNGQHWFFEQSSYLPKRFIPFKKWQIACPETPELMRFAYQPIKYLGANELKQIIHFFPKNHPRFTEHRIKYFSLLSSPLICLMIVLLAIPFSLNGVRTNPMVGVSKAVGLFFIYYIVGNIGRMLGTQGYLSPVIAAWLPNLLMLIFGIGLYKKLAPQ